MFTGIISHSGRFYGYRRGRQEIVVEAPDILPEKLRMGGSMAVNGVCLSLLKSGHGRLHFHLSQETIERTTLGRLKAGERLNFELPLDLSSPLSGHLVTGHVDAVGTVLKKERRPPGQRIALSFPEEIRPYFIPKGSVALNGVSLTIASLRTSSMEIELIPLTLEGTNLGDLKSGQPVNIECDIIGKYVYNWMLHGWKPGSS